MSFVVKWTAGKKMPPEYKQQIENDIIKTLVNAPKHYRLKHIKEKMANKYSQIELQVVLKDMEERGLMSILKKSQACFYRYIGE